MAPSFLSRPRPCQYNTCLSFPCEVQFLPIHCARQTTTTLTLISTNSFQRVKYSHSHLFAFSFLFPSPRFSSSKKIFPTFSTLTSSFHAFSISVSQEFLIIQKQD